ncbi:hypothetical protein LPB67_09580 [Undibacterium sp. Jales W-56]|uniref:hypothetical protein n=1 Tax=Undibacterium sp. Jales W-56 TaxID=2897325 RepID=UPI0021D376C8|nr:hypothetical protein [Undibacterium sp. Jales W-56]MCU6434016.1 hypothetical protein [Undibacterium sp. Jales W-56]
MFIKRLTIFFLLFCSLTGAAQANMPESGWWWNASEAGRGYSIEIQDNQIFVAAYTYDANKQPVWYYSSGTLSGDSSYSGRVVKAVNGSCFGCSQGTPQSLDSGAITIKFNGAKDATLTIMGYTTQITRFDFANGDNTRYPNACYGEWSGVYGSPSFPVYNGERIKFNSTYIATDGTNYLKGYRTGSTANIALCSYDANSGYWSMILDSSTSYYQFFQFKFTGFNRMEGTHWTFLKGGTIAGSGENWVAFRTASKSFVLGLIAPATEKSEMMVDPNVLQTASEARLARDKSLADVSKGGTPVQPQIQDVLSKQLRALSAIQK